MTTAVREGIMHEFKNTDFSVISNARCLTEGVDLPAVDMVAFMSPKKSKVDIIQATGRAMRKDPQNPKKNIGYILVPLYLEITTCESIEDAIVKADFGEVWNVLQALQEHDKVLADIITQLQVDKGRDKLQKDAGLGEIIDILGVNIPLKTLQESITAVCVDKLGFTWDLRYGELIKYKEQNGNCNVPTKWTENKQLGTWVSTQRQYYYSKKLNKEKLKRLEDIGFIWDKLEFDWQEMFEALKKFMKIHGNCNILQNWPEAPKLVEWTHQQRFLYRDERLSADKIRCLKELSFIFDLHELYWEEMFDSLKEYKQEHGNCNVPYEYKTKTNKTLGRWVNQQRFNKSSRLTADQINNLEKIGFKWEEYGF
jgi:hypothetical protein